MAKRKKTAATSIDAWPGATMWPLANIKPYENNPRTHPEAQIELLAKLLRKFGPDQPIVVDEDGVILKGHGRLLAAKQAELNSFPVVQRVGLSGDDKRALRISDNSVALLSNWDADLMRLETTELQLAGYDLTLLGFDNSQLVEFMASPQSTNDPEATPEPPVNPVSRTGDLWILGDHRILCGDSTSEKDVTRLMNGEKAALMNTDPPYGVNYGGIRDSIRASGRGGKKYSNIENDELNGEMLQQFLEKCIRAALPHLIANPAFYLWHPMLTQGTFFAAAAAAAADILIHRQIIWVKPSLILGRGDYHWRHELCFYGWIKGKRCRWLSGRDQTTVWEIGRENNEIHPTQKPVELFKRPFENNTKAGEIGYEPFSGSGSQVIAAEMTNRRCFAMEISAPYVDVAVQRWSEFTGKKAILDGDGRSFDEIAKERLAKPKRGRPRTKTAA